MINANGTENGANGVNYGVNDDTNDIEVPDKIETVQDTMKKMPDSEQERAILKIKSIKMEDSISQTFQCII